MKAFADDKINVTKEFKFVLGRVENIVQKGENADHQQLIISVFDWAVFKLVGFCFEFDWTMLFLNKNDHLTLYHKKKF